MDNEKVIGYRCKIDWDWELGCASGGTRIYSSIEDLMEHHKCVEGCGIVMVETTLKSVIQEEKGFA